MLNASVGVAHRLRQQPGAAIGPIDVEPQVTLTAYVRDAIQVVDDAGVGCSGRCRDGDDGGLLRVGGKCASKFGTD